MPHGELRIHVLFGEEPAQPAVRDRGELTVLGSGLHGASRLLAPTEGQHSIREVRERSAVGRVEQGLSEVRDRREQIVLAPTRRREEDPTREVCGRSDG
jgi:hypothetical protein